MPSATRRWPSISATSPSMGATPRAALLSLALPRDAAWSRSSTALCSTAFSRSLACDGDAARRAGTQSPVRPVRLMIGRSPAIGSAPRRKLLRRSGRRAGDELYVTGALRRRPPRGLLIRQSGNPDGDGECLTATSGQRPKLRAGRLVRSLAAPPAPQSTFRTAWPTAPGQLAGCRWPRRSRKLTL
jgi:hypothetical protein